MLRATLKVRMDLHNPWIVPCKVASGQYFVQQNYRFVAHTMDFLQDNLRKVCRIKQSRSNFVLRSLFTQGHAKLTIRIMIS